MVDDVSGAVHIRPMLPEDAPALAECFRRCYGESYVVAEFYDPEATARRVREGGLRSVVAIAPSGEIVGHMGLTVRHPDARTVDAGNSIVDPRYRGRNIVARLGMGVRERCAADGFLGFHHYPTTVHTIMQKLSVMAEGFETGIMLGYIPAGTDYREIDGAPRADRPAVTVVYNPLAPTPAREVYVPDCYRELTAAIYSAGNLPRTLLEPTSTPPNHATTLEIHENPRRGLLRIVLLRMGGDAAEAVSNTIRESASTVVQVDLPMNDPALGFTVRSLRANGFVFSAILPEWLDGDWLRLQRMADPHATFAVPDLANDTARRILTAIQNER